MRIHSASLAGLAFTAFACLVRAVEVQVADDAIESDPDISVIAQFPEDNPFGQIVNGERNNLNLFVENNSELNITLLAAAGAFFDVQTDQLIKNATTIPYGLRLYAGSQVQVPYSFHSEFAPGDIRLNIWLTHLVGDKIYRVTAYDNVITVVEPEVSIFDYQVISTYLITAAFLGGLGYFAFITFFPKAKKTRKPVTASGGKQAISAPVGSVTASGVGGYEEEWIPEHHLKPRGGKKRAGNTSGDEVSGGETSGTEGKKRKGRK